MVGQMVCRLSWTGMVSELFEGGPESSKFTSFIKGIENFGIIQLFK